VNGFKALFLANAVTSGVCAGLLVHGVPAKHPVWAAGAAIDMLFALWLASVSWRKATS